MDLGYPRMETQMDRYHTLEYTLIVLLFRSRFHGTAWHSAAGLTKFAGHMREVAGHNGGRKNIATIKQKTR